VRKAVRNNVFPFPFAPRIHVVVDSLIFLNITPVGCSPLARETLILPTAFDVLTVYVCACEKSAAPVWLGSEGTAREGPAAQHLLLT
jgi:hypothetical protein